MAPPPGSRERGAGGRWYIMRARRAWGAEPSGGTVGDVVASPEGSVPSDPFPADVEADACHPLEAVGGVLEDPLEPLVFGCLLDPEVRGRASVRSVDGDALHVVPSVRVGGSKGQDAIRSIDPTQFVPRCRCRDPARSGRFTHLSVRDSGSASRTARAHTSDRSRSSPASTPPRSTPSRRGAPPPGGETGVRACPGR